MRRSPLAVLFLTVFLDLVGFGIVIPLLPFYAEHFGASPFLVGVLMASYSLMQFLFAPFWGRLSDRIGRRKVLLVSIAGSAASLTAFGLANSYGALLAARAFAGVAGANIATAQAYVADVTTPATRAKGMGVIGAAFGLGFIFGPAIGGFFGRWGFALPAFVAAGLAALNLVLAFFLLPEPERAPTARPQAGILGLRRLVEDVTDPVVLGLLALGFLMTTAFAQLESTFGLWGERVHGFDASSTGYVFAYIGVVMAVVQGGLVGPLARRFGERALLLTGLAGMALALAALPYATTLPSLLVVMGGVATANGLAIPTAAALLSMRAAADDQGGTLGVAQSLSSLARVVGPLLGGFLFGAVGVGAPFVVGAAGMVVAFAAAWMLLVRGPPAPATAAARASDE